MVKLTFANISNSFTVAGLDCGIVSHLESPSRPEAFACLFYSLIIYYENKFILNYEKCMSFGKPKRRAPNNYCNLLKIRSLYVLRY